MIAELSGNASLISVFAVFIGLICIVYFITAIGDRTFRPTVPMLLAISGTLILTLYCIDLLGWDQHGIAFDKLEIYRESKTEEPLYRVYYGKFAKSYTELITWFIDEELMLTNVNINNIPLRETIYPDKDALINALK